MQINDKKIYYSTMITLLASLVGFISSILPEAIKYFKDINDKQHELELLDRQLEYSKANLGRSIEEIHVSRDIFENASLYSTYKIDIGWVDALNGTVRPILAYCFFFMYLSVKYFQYKAICMSDNIVHYLEIIWNIDDQAIFAGIISFYFGQRTFRKFWGRAK